MCFHNLVKMETKFSENSDYLNNYYYCNVCNYKCCKKQHIKQHFLSQSHKKRTGNQVSNNGNHTIIQDNVTKNNIFECSCGNKYKNRSGLWKHKKTCFSINQTQNQNQNQTSFKDLTDKELILTLLKENKDLQSMMIEQQNMVLELCKNGISNTTNVTQTNSNNKTFNLQIFLNETCKDAMNITEFVQSIQLQLTDLEKVGEIGYIDGISNIILKNLKGLDITQRPIHCTDKKRDVLYVKDENKWEKEDEENKTIRKAIKQVAHKNTRLLSQFREKYPDCGKSESKYADQYNKLIIEAMGGTGSNDMEKENKIIKRIAKEVIIEK